jgi:hypothetical protein
MSTGNLEAFPKTFLNFQEKESKYFISEVLSSPSPAPDGGAHAAPSEMVSKSKFFLENSVEWPPVIKKYRLLQADNAE